VETPNIEKHGIETRAWNKEIPNMKMDKSRIWKQKKLAME